jgi:hypothetical protein
MHTGVLVKSQVLGFEGFYDFSTLPVQTHQTIFPLDGTRVAVLPNEVPLVVAENSIPPGLLCYTSL